MLNMAGFSAKILVPFWNLFQPRNYSTYRYYHICQNYSRKGTMILKMPTNNFLECKQQHLSIKNNSNECACNLISFCSMTNLQ